MEMNCCEIQSMIDSALANVKILGTQAVMKLGRTILADGDLVPFNTVLANQNPSVSLDISTGIFTVLKGGNYVVQYYVNVDGSDMGTTVIMDCNGIKSEAIYSIQGQSAGMAVLSLAAGDKIILKNASGQSIVLDGTEAQAGIMIYTV